jgi:large subunit ribosomal protein L6
MSRVAKQAIAIPTGVTVTVGEGVVTVKGAKGALSLPVSAGVSVAQEDKRLQVSYADDGAARTRAGATRAHLANMVVGVTRGYDRKLLIPEGISIETPSPTEILIKGADRQRVGQTAAEIRGIRPPEPYKGKGVRYSDEVISLKEGKKK